MRTATDAQRSSARTELVLASLLLAAFVGALMSITPAQAQTDPYSNETPRVMPTRIENTETGTVAGTGTVRERPGTGVLPFTGADLTLFLVTGAAAVGTGSLLWKRSGRV